MRVQLFCGARQKQVAVADVDTDTAPVPLRSGPSAEILRGALTDSECADEPSEAGSADRFQGLGIVAAPRVFTDV